jgi:hypothetical protein
MPDHDGASTARHLWALGQLGSLNAKPVLTLLASHPIITSFGLT